MAILLGGMIAGVIAGLLMPAEQRKKLSRLLAVPIGHCLEQMPDGWPWKEIMSGVLQTLEQNIQMVALLQEQQQQ